MNVCNLLNTVRKKLDYAINAVLICKTKARVAGKINFDDLLIAFFYTMYKLLTSLNLFNAFYRYLIFFKILIKSHKYVKKNYVALDFNSLNKF